MPNPRSDYSNIFEREPLKLPGGARVVVWPVINVEEWDINEPMARTVLPVPQGRSVIPDVPNYAWYDYGMRVGFWRMKQVLDRHGIRATVSLNASVCNTYPHLVEESLKSGWEMMAHGFIQRIINAEPDQRETIRKTISQHARHKKQSGGHGEFGDVHLNIKPLPRGSGFEYKNTITGGVVPKQYIPAVENGVKEFMVRGPLGFPVVPDV